MRVSIFSKFSYLTLARTTQLAAPLVLYPIFIGRVGLEMYGFVIFWTSIAAFISTIAGLNIETYASRRVREATEDSKESAIAFLVPIYLKGVAFILLVIPWAVLSFIWAKDVFEGLAILFAFHPLLLIFVSPTHYVLGKGVFGVQLGALLGEKITLLILVLMLVRESADYWRIPIIYTCAAAVSGVIYYIYTRGFYRRAGLREVISHFKDYTQIALMLTIGKVTQLHTNFAKVIAGMVFGYSMVAVYDVVEKIVNIGKLPSTILGQLHFSSKKHSILSHTLLLVSQLIVVGALIAILAGAGSYLIEYLMSDKYAPWMHDVLLIQSLILVAILFTTVFGLNLVVLYGDPNAYSRLMLIANFMSIAMLILWLLWGDHNIYWFSGWVAASEAIFAFLCTVCGVRIFKKKYMDGN